MGSSKANLWIRCVHVEAPWVCGDDFYFKTAHANFGESLNFLARMFGGAWLSPRDLLEISDGNVSPTLGNHGVPKDQTSSQQVTLKARPVKVLVSHATFKKDTEVVSHFDVFVCDLRIEAEEQSTRVLAALTK